MNARTLMILWAVWLPLAGWSEAVEPAHPVNEWVKRSPLASAPPSPRLGYEGACVWDSARGLLVRYGGHNQGGGGEQGAEVWTFDLASAAWTLKEPNLSPPGVCCNAQNVFDPVGARYLRFPNFSGSHGWQWRREIYLNDSSVWSYDLPTNTWRNMRPVPAPRLAPLRCASWDERGQVVVVFGGEGGREGTVVYDPWVNEWRWMTPAVEPEPRSGGQMAYDAARGVHVLFGSQFSDDPHTWLYDLRKNEWRDASPEVMPPTDRNDAVLAYDPVNRVVLAIVKVTTGEDDAAEHRLETWAYDAGENRWSRMRPATEPEPSGSRARQLVFAPDLNLAILENCPSDPREQQIWTYRLGPGEPGAGFGDRAREAVPRPEPPLVEDVTASVISSRRVELTWMPPNDPRIAGYHVERARVEVLTEDQLVRLKRNTAPLAEPSVGALRRFSAFERLTQEPVGGTGFVDAAVDLSTAGVVVEAPIEERTYSDDEVDRLGKRYRFAVFAYRVRAVTADGGEGGPSPPCFTIPSAPQWLFSREDGESCRLKWGRNPERGVVGYRVYRMDGRYDDEPVSRLTAEPVPENAFVDQGAGRVSRRYYVVAVDALGQEGFPSSPVWFNREWRSYYEPFVGDWHQ